MLFNNKFKGGDENVNTKVIINFTNEIIKKIIDKSVENTSNLVLTNTPKQSRFNNIIYAEEYNDKTITLSIHDFNDIHHDEIFKAICYPAFKEEVLTKCYMYELNGNHVIAYFDGYDLDYYTPNPYSDTTAGVILDVFNTTSITRREFLNMYNHNVVVFHGSGMTDEFNKKQTYSEVLPLLIKALI